MLKGKKVYLRPFKENDIEHFVEKVNSLESKGEYLPLTLTNQVEIQKKFAENGFISEDFGRFLIVEKDTDRPLGYAVYFRGTHYTPGYELGYVIYSTKDRGKGFCSDALEILTSWIFLSKDVYRLQLCMDTENIGSRKVGEKCGYRFEGTMRGATFSRGEYRDLDLLSMTREDFKKRNKE